jgi:beta-N-acetylhexosaminidase
VQSKRNSRYGGGKTLRRLFYWLTLLIVLTSILKPTRSAEAETQLQTTDAKAILDSMTPEERVGQLFLVTFQGTETHDQTQIYDLIANHHVGGVVLQAANDNFLPQPDTISNAYQLIRNLQTIESGATKASPSAPNAQSEKQVYVPLFIGISQEGDGAPHDQILSGLTPLPDLMAIGATWRTDLAQQVGQVMGKELSALGFNLYLGPSLDVVESPNPSAQIDLGTRVFGGDPFWVGQMGRAYIAGLHHGSNDRMVVIAKHFPGRGASDRSPEKEVATVRKPLEQLKQVELPPFFAVTGSTQLAENADGLLVSHIRYQGFQENIRATTRPVSLDAEALLEIMGLPEFTTWRKNGGLVVSDALGSPAVRDFYSQTGENFLPRSVARDAFQAGNDLLYLGNITSDAPEADTYTSTLEILDFFAQQYQDDRTFAQLVDAAVLRILDQKFRMYGEFTLANVLAPESGLENIGTSQDVVSEVARSAATLIDPDPQELNSRLPQAPTPGDHIVFLTDTSNFKQCTTCLWEQGLAVDALQKTVLRLYGPTGSGQVLASRLNPYSFDELKSMLDDESQTDIEAVLGSADWIVISLTGVSDGQVDLLQRFFSERASLLRTRNVILFSFTAPYYLDPTDISKSTAYYALYSKQPAFVEVAARLLFERQQITLQGASPVSIPGVGYDLHEATKPDEDQIIPLTLDQPMQEITPTVESGTVTPEVEPTQTPIPLFRVGDTVAVQAGPIVDHNQHIVPDGTPVRFTMSTTDENGEILQFFDATTVDGVAHASFDITRPVSVKIRAISEPAVVSSEIQIPLESSNEGAAAVTVVPQPSPTITPTPTVMPSPTPTNELIGADGHPRVGMWLIVMVAVIGSTLLTYWAMSRLISPRWGVRWALCVFLGGLAAYNYLALGFPRAANWVATSSGAFGVLMLTLAGELLGSLAAWIWMKLFSEPKLRED